MMLYFQSNGIEVVRQGRRRQECKGLLFLWQRTLQHVAQRVCGHQRDCHKQQDGWSEAAPAPTPAFVAFQPSSVEHVEVQHHPRCAEYYGTPHEQRRQGCSNSHAACRTPVCVLRQIAHDGQYRSKADGVTQCLGSRCRPDSQNPSQLRSTGDAGSQTCFVLHVCASNG